MQVKKKIYTGLSRNQGLVIRKLERISCFEVINSHQMILGIDHLTLDDLIIIGALEDIQEV